MRATVHQPPTRTRELCGDGAPQQRLELHGDGVGGEAAPEEDALSQPRDVLDAVPQDVEGHAAVLDDLGGGAPGGAVCEPILEGVAGGWQVWLGSRGWVHALAAAAPTPLAAAPQPCTCLLAQRAVALAGLQPLLLDQRQVGAQIRGAVGEVGGVDEVPGDCVQRQAAGAGW